MATVVSPSAVARKRKGAGGCGASAWRGPHWSSGTKGEGGRVARSASCFSLSFSFLFFPVLLRRAGTCRFSLTTALPPHPSCSAALQAMNATERLREIEAELQLLGEASSILAKQAHALKVRARAVRSLGPPQSLFALGFL